MIWVHIDDFGKPEKILEFIKKRVIRIYPLVWFSTLTMFTIYLVTPGTGKPILPCSIARRRIAWPRRS
jgi:peptidoglycan/LPS O-acetylase OafA/YrhL